MKKTLLSLAILGLGIGAASAAPIADKEELTIMPAQSVHSYILLDRTGSMGSIWDEALGSVNAYAKSVGEADEGEIEGDDIKTNVTLAVFDYQESLQFNVLREGVEAENWKEVTNDEASPRGMTPLFDAINRIVNVAEADKPEKAVIVIMTDGHENSSKEVTKDGAKAALDRARDKGWEVVFLGAEFASFGDAEGVGQSASKNMAVGAGNFSSSMSNLAKKSRAYGKGEEAEITFDDADRAQAGEEDVIQRKGQ